MMGRIPSSSFVAAASAIITASLGVASDSVVSGQDVEDLRPAYYKKWRENPKVGRGLFVRPFASETK